MYKLIKAGNYEFKDPEGSFSLKTDDILNEYEGEDGHTTIEIVREGKISASVSYKGLTVEDVTAIKSHLHPVTGITIFDPLTNEQKSFEAKISGISVSKIYHKHELSVWSLSFDIDEL